MRQTFGILSSALLASFVSTVAWAASDDEAAKASSDALRLAAGLTDTSARMTAIGLSSLAEADPSGPSIDTTWIRTGDDVLERLDQEEVDLALLPLEEIGADALDRHPELRAVMKYWASENAAEVSQRTKVSGHLLVARASLESERVEALLDIALQDHVVLEAARIDVNRLTPEAALIAFPIAAHDGVQSYLQRQGLDIPPKPAERPSGVVDDIGEAGEAPIPGYSRADIMAARLDLQGENDASRSFTLYFDTGDAAIDRSGFQSVAAACNYAASLPGARFVISGHTDTVGSETDNYKLSDRRANAVADAIRNDPRFREALSVIEFGEQRLAVATGDEVAEPMNRRVEITVIETP